ARRFLEARNQVLGLLDDAHAAAAAAERGLDDERIADLVGRLADGGLGLHRALDARHDRYARLDGKAPRRGLVAERLEQLRVRPDERDPRLFAGARQVGILRQEPVARVDGVDALLARQRDNALYVEVGLDRAFALADLVGLVGLEAVQTERVFLGEDGDGPQPELGRRPHDADGDFPAVERKQLFHDEERRRPGIQPFNISRGSGVFRAGLRAYPGREYRRRPAAGTGIRPGGSPTLKSWVRAAGDTGARSPDGPGAPQGPMLRAGIVGLPNVGKSTLFNAVTRTRKAEAANYPFCTIEPNVGVVTVPDPRLAVLQQIAKTDVVIPAVV